METQRTNEFRPGTWPWVMDDRFRLMFKGIPKESKAIIYEKIIKRLALHHLRCHNDRIKMTADIEKIILGSKKLK
ncbi:MAG: hypothetical protein E4G95_03265 [Bacteroidia bacterium]|nr:MAG: hypothetical protein E4G95_03265 [Bacteroidia bacterium]